MLLAAPGGHIFSGAAFALASLGAARGRTALRGTSGGATMPTPGGACTPRLASCDIPRARLIGFYYGVGVLLVYFSPALRFAALPPPDPYIPSPSNARCSGA